MAPIEKILEVVLYVEDPERAKSFYCDVLGFKEIDRYDRGFSLNVGDNSVLLLFQRGASLRGARAPGGWIPPHDGSGQQHIAFAVREGDLDRWRDRLEMAGVKIESEVTWPRGGRSIYFRDPDGHSIELVAPGTWPIY
ncbi:MAG: glyoxalase [Gemmatimonadales bacterium]|nr:Glutathione transferase FosA [bacterium HR33]GIW51559.1 MAG: glyoxalase [Gemmatimonadales bacterium]